MGATSEGSVGLGFVLGFFLGVVGVAVAFLGLKAPLTKKGAMYGLGAQLAVGWAVGLAIGLAVPLLTLR